MRRLIERGVGKGVKTECVTARDNARLTEDMCIVAMVVLCTYVYVRGYISGGVEFIIIDCG